MGEKSNSYIEFFIVKTVYLFSISTVGHIVNTSCLVGSPPSVSVARYPGGNTYI